MNIKIKALSISITLLVSAPLFALGNNVVLRVFNLKGDIHLIESHAKRKCYVNAVISANSILDIVKGEATLISDDLSRIVIDKPGKYHYKDLINKLEKPKENIHSRFYDYLKTLIKKEKSEGTSPGGVVRGNDFMIMPFDSATILGNAIPVARANHFRNDIKLIVRNPKGKALHQQILDKEEIILRMEDQIWWESGWYFFTFYHTDDKIQLVRRIYIPTSEERTEILEQYDWIFEGISAEIPLDQRLNLGYKALESNKLCLYYH